MGEIEIKPVDMSTTQVDTSTQIIVPVMAAGDWRKKLLVSPDDDCMTCGHDPHTTHPEGKACKTPTGNGKMCRCRRFRPAGTTVAPCAACGHDEDHGHAVTPCDEWGPHGPCNCADWLDAAEPF